MVAQRSEQAFELLVQHHQARAYRIAYSMLGNEADARYISQRAFIRLFKSAHKFDGRSRFSTWFYPVLVKLCRNRERRGKWWKKLLPLAGPGHGLDQRGIDPLSSDRGADAAAIGHQFSGRLGEALRRLSTDQRIAVLLQVQAGLSSPDIAQVLHCSENTARADIYRGMAALKKLLGNE